MNFPTKAVTIYVFWVLRLFSFCDSRSLVFSARLEKLPERDRGFGCIYVSPSAPQQRRVGHHQPMFDCVPGFNATMASRHGKNVQ